MKSTSQLSSLGFATATVVIRKAKGDEPEQSLTVRGVSTQDIMKLMRVHGASLLTILNTTLAERAAEGGEGVSEDLASKFIFGLVEQLPDAIADLIVIVTDTPPEEVAKAFAVATRLPLPAQLKLLQEIVRVTLEDFGGLGEFMETVISLAGSMNGLMASIRMLQAGSLTSTASAPS